MVVAVTMPTVGVTPPPLFGVLGLLLSITLEVDWSIIADAGFTWEEGPPPPPGAAGL